MIEELSQETIEEYADNAQTIDKPQGVNWSKGVVVGRTAPAKWWNWIFRAVTQRVRQARNDASNMLTELQNVVTDSGMTLDPSSDTQLSSAVGTKASNAIVKYVDDNKRAYRRNWIASDAPGNKMPEIQAGNVLFRRDTEYESGVPSARVLLASTDNDSWVEVIRVAYSGELGLPFIFKGRFYCTNDTDMHISYDGFTWESITFSSLGDSYHILDEEYLVLYADDTPRCKITSDGDTWIDVSPTSYVDKMTEGILKSGDRFFVFGTNTEDNTDVLLVSEDLINWTKLKEDVHNNKYTTPNVRISDGRYLAEFGTNIYLITDLYDVDNWNIINCVSSSGQTPISLASPATISGFHYVHTSESEGVYILTSIDDDHTLPMITSRYFVSYDGITFRNFRVLTLNGYAAHIYKVLYSSGLFMFLTTRDSVKIDTVTSDFTDYTSVVERNIQAVDANGTTFTIGYLSVASDNVLLAADQAYQHTYYKRIDEDVWHEMFSTPSDKQARLIGKVWYEIGDTTYAAPLHSYSSDLNTKFTTNRYINVVVNGTLYLK